MAGGSSQTTNELEHDIDIEEDSMLCSEALDILLQMLAEEYQVTPPPEEHVITLTNEKDQDVIEAQQEGVSLVESIRESIVLFLEDHLRQGTPKREISAISLWQHCKETIPDLAKSCYRASILKQEAVFLIKQFNKIHKSQFSLVRYHFPRMLCYFSLIAIINLLVFIILELQRYDIRRGRRKNLTDSTKTV